MRWLLCLVLLCLSCSPARARPREVYREVIRERQRVEIVDALESSVAEANKLRGELAEATKTRNEQTANTTSKASRLIVFTATEWCAPCRTLDVEIKKLGEMTYTDSEGKTRKWSEHIGDSGDKAIQIVELSQESDAELAVEFKVTAVPTIIRVDCNGNEESRVTGVIDADTLCRYQAGTWKPQKQPIDEKKIVRQKVVIRSDNGG